MATVWLRLWKLGNLPGVNGDEAWSGVQVLRFLAGENVAWRTPTGNPMNLFHFGPLVVLHAWLPADFAVLRSVAAASGLLALAANYWLCRKSFDWLTAVASTILLAALPINVAYSRFAWDASQTLLATLLAIHASLIAVRIGAARRKATCWAIALLGISVWVHPTNVFIAPLVGVCLAFAWRSELTRVWESWLTGTKRKATFAAAVVLGMALAWFLGPWIHVAARRLINPYDYVLFVRDFVRLFSGATVYRFISGSNGSAALDVSDLVAALLLGLATYGFWRRWQRDRNACDGCLAVGWALGTLGFFLVAGPGAIAPNFERYAIWLVAPTTLLVTRGAGWWLGRRSSVGAFARAGFAATCLMLLASFYANYFQYIQQTGGTAHRTFRTAAVEPKQQALQYILANSVPDQPLQIVTDEWWSYWPLAYLAFGKPDVEVIARGRLPGVDEAPLTETASDIKTRWHIVFADATVTSGAEPASNTGHSKDPKHTCNDYAGRAVLELYNATEKISQNY